MKFPFKSIYTPRHATIFAIAISICAGGLGPSQTAFAAEIPVRAGLWEITLSGPSIAQRVRNTSADKQKTMEQVAGLQIRGDTLVRRVCISKEMIAQGSSIKSRPDCPATQTWNGKQSQLTYLCTNGASGKGEFNYKDKENYTGWLDSLRTAKDSGEKQLTRVNQTGKWLATNCNATIN
jgi:hypothetical protein